MMNKITPYVNENYLVKSLYNTSLEPTVKGIY